MFSKMIAACHIEARGWGAIFIAFFAVLGISLSAAVIVSALIKALS